MGDTLGCFKKPVLEALSLKPRVEGGLAAPDRRRGRLGIGSRGGVCPPPPGRALCLGGEAGLLQALPTSLRVRLPTFPRTQTPQAPGMDRGPE